MTLDHRYGIGSLKASLCRGLRLDKMELFLYSVDIAWVEKFIKILGDDSAMNNLERSATSLRDTSFISYFDFLRYQASNEKQS